MVDSILFYLFALIVGFAYGFVAQREQFCFSGGIKDILLFNHKKRTLSLLVAIITALLLTQLLAKTLTLDLTQTRYFVHIDYLWIVIGSVLFGVGMMLADGCVSRHLVKMAQGERDSLLILISIGLFSYATYTLFIDYLQPLKDTHFVPFIPLFLMVLVLALLIYKNSNRLTHLLQCWDGFAIGMIIACGWFITSVVAEYLFIFTPIESLSLVYPAGRAIEYAVTQSTGILLSFSLLTLIGIILGAFISAKTNTKYTAKQLCDNSGFNPPKLHHKLFGGALMGIGGILAIGCTVGQGLSGLSTLSLASLIAITTIYLSAMLTGYLMKRRNALIACYIFEFKP
jgi:uncharacterized membrane protein YedE/YeeE